MKALLKTLIVSLALVAGLAQAGSPQTNADGVTETADRLYVQNLHLKALGWQAR